MATLPASLLALQTISASEKALGWMGALVGLALAILVLSCRDRRAAAPVDAAALGRALRALQERLGGRLDPADAGVATPGRPRLRFVCRGTPALLECFAGPGCDLSYFRLSFPAPVGYDSGLRPPPRLEVYPRSARAWIRPRPGLETARTGFPEFDRVCLILSSRPAEADVWLPERAVDSWLWLMRRFPDGGLSCAAGAPGIEVRLADLSVSSGELEEFAVGAALFTEALRAGRAWPSPPPAAAPPGDGAFARCCPACGEGAPDGPVCPVCCAPHHPACREEVGGCATYGCAGSAEE